jgi:hypothetical protein
MAPLSSKMVPGKWFPPNLYIIIMYADLSSAVGTTPVPLCFRPLATMHVECSVTALEIVLPVGETIICQSVPSTELLPVSRRL